MLEIAIQRFLADVLLNLLMIQPTKAVVHIMENLFFLVVAAILLAVSVFFLISYLKDRKKTKLTFNKRKW
jgi:Ca2+/Na+ antiporter